jgi:tRNA threonylcarbamoyl adenosine modification protein (Sua5/YciO/YrdC/YwlC family)
MTEYKSLNSENEESVIFHAVEVLKKGGIILYPTETVYGIGCDVKNEKAVKKIAQFKQRNNRKPNFSVGIANKKGIEKYVKIDERRKGLIDKLLPGPFTLIFDSNQIILPEMKTIGIRIPEKSFFSQLLFSSEMAIITTSANLKGKNAPSCFIEIEREVLDFVDYAIDGECTKYGEGSTIINATQEKFKIIREGAGKIKSKKILDLL